jgi:hypothetical protein
VDKGSSHWRICLRCGMGAVAGMERSVDGIAPPMPGAPDRAAADQRQAKACPARHASV